jgi:hypothetical protein
MKVCKCGKCDRIVRKRKYHPECEYRAAILHRQRSEAGRAPKRQYRRLG